ncbi:polysaccharide lyase [Noviherbaspirillum aridicola]|uniref:Polysaccharide lyase 14 domain-containing protein n=1 Tax=Noviherbaspirillum aridicola TaxID=2849687 RepID=A0ABQ4Q5W2_9BURK|nr:hypothetical protein [Noviherbaspirillum aridicola]GIZ52513.1 hypothetical protein NCCP691_25270 [Noviherbaspirillum aridicola]
MRSPLIRFACAFLCMTAIVPGATAAPVERFGDLEAGIESFPRIKNLWGAQNLTFVPRPDGRGKIMRVFVPQGAIDPGSMRKRGLPPGGAGFKTQVFPAGERHALLSYSVRFADNVDFARGGKLPGLYGGSGNSGGKIPDGRDGFSFRLMWGEGGRGSVYAYLPTSVKYGTSLVRHRFHFKKGVWHRVVQEVVLNDPGQANGVVRMWFDGVAVGEATGLVVRTDDALKVDGMFFDVFYGGNDDTWAPSVDTTIEFADFVVRAGGAAPASAATN